MDYGRLSEIQQEQQQKQPIATIVIIMSNSSINHFHLTLPSNASMDIYLNNTTAQYVTKLPRLIELDGGDWNVSLKDISTPILFDNVPSNTYNFKLIGFREHALDMSLPGKM